jgi:RHS repeat-associated protein
LAHENKTILVDVEWTLNENLEPVAGFGEAIRVTSPDELEELQSELINIPGDGFFYTYLTNFSDNVVTFDNLTIRHKQVEQLLFVAKRKIRDAHPASRRCGRVLRAIKEYYPYGLEWGRYDGNRMYNQGLANTPLQEREWGVLGLDQNYFSARFYDPTIGRWHAVDPLEQFHSPYIAMCNDPANNIDPDGRAGVHLIEKEDVAFMAFAIGSSALIYSTMANISAASFASIKHIFSIGGPLQTVVSNTKLFVLNFASSVRDVAGAFGKDALWRSNFGESNINSGLDFSARHITNQVFAANSGIHGIYLGTFPWPGNFGSKILDGVQLVLDVLGLIPGLGEFCDGASALISLGRGEYAEAAISVSAMIPFVGWVAGGTKIAMRFRKLFRSGRVTEKVIVEAPTYGKVVDDGAEVAVDVVKEAGHLTPWQKMTNSEKRAFQHSYSRHASEFELPNWSQSRAAELQTQFNNAITNIRNAGATGFFKSTEFVNGVSTTVNRTEPLINGQRFYYYETIDGQFISAGKMP